MEVPQWDSGAEPLEARYTYTICSGQMHFRDVFIEDIRCTFRLMRTLQSLLPPPLLFQKSSSNLVVKGASAKYVMHSCLVLLCVTEKAEQDLAKAQVEYDRMVKEKDMMIETLSLKVNTMCAQFETLFHVSVLHLLVSFCSVVQGGI